MHNHKFYFFFDSLKLFVALKFIMVLTQLLSEMNNSFTNKNISNLKTEKLDWSLIQSEMKNKLGLDIYESWLKKINL